MRVLLGFSAAIFIKTYWENRIRFKTAAMKGSIEG
tara:strand:+ start:1209 stop:1313 length:105 start_codon:yes stop_codon:yes gene_type:complete